MQLDQGNHSAAVLAGRVKDYFKTEELSNVKADVDLVIFAKEEPGDAAPAGQCAKLASSSAAAAPWPAAPWSAAAYASTAGNHAGASCLRELTRFPAHNLILDGTVYFSTQQVRGNHAVFSSIPCTTVFHFPVAHPMLGGPDQLWLSEATETQNVHAESSSNMALLHDMHQANEWLHQCHFGS
jgi:hypothetical protein